MAILTYSDLITAIAKYANRQDDASFVSSVHEFIRLAESRLNRELALRVMEMDIPVTCASGGQTIGLPPDYVEPIALKLTTFGVVTPLKMSVAGEMPLRQWGGVPTEWCINEGNIQLDGPCDQNHTFIFRYRKAFNLSSAQPMNWLLKNHPDVYLAAALVWGNVFMFAPEMAAPWKSMLEEALNEIGWKEARSRTGTLSVDPALARRRGFNIISG